VELTTLPLLGADCVGILRALMSWKFQGLSRAVQSLPCLYIEPITNNFAVTHTHSQKFGAQMQQFKLSILISRGPGIVTYSYNESQRDALFLKFI
jgi:hypothetical protein